MRNRLLISEIDRLFGQAWHQICRGNAMNKTEPTRPIEEGIDESNEAVVRDRLKTVDEGKKTAAPRSEVKRRVLSQPVPR